MKEFLQTNKVTYNLMSFTAFKSMLLFSYLLEQPRSYEEIREYFAQQEYLNETISIDTLRVYINSLERMGCEIVRGKRAEGAKYKLLKHPFELRLKDDQVKSILRVFKTLSKTIDVEDMLSITRFFKKISAGIDNEDLKVSLENISPLTKINSEVLVSLIRSCRKNEEITVAYNSPGSGIKTIDILAEKLTISNNKVYLHGKSPQYKNTASLLVSRIIEKPIVKLERTIISQETPLLVGCEIYDNDFSPLENEKILEKKDDRFVVEISSTNKFLTRQRILALGKKCKVLYPEDFREDIVSLLKKMKEEYVTKKV
ncbi:hypothetical protein IJZ97_01480 [bacterium]|nr:hypothetical protein [bacterium]